MPVDTCSASAIIVIIGLTPDDAGKRLASATYAPGKPNTAPSPSQTADALSEPIRHVPIWCALNSGSRLGAVGAALTSLQNLSIETPDSRSHSSRAVCSVM